MRRNACSRGLRLRAVDDDAGGAEREVVGPAHDLDGLERGRGAGQREERRLGHDEREADRGERVAGELAEARRAVDEHEVVVVGDALERDAQPQRGVATLGHGAVLERPLRRDQLHAETPARRHDGVGRDARDGRRRGRRWSCSARVAGSRAAVALACGSRSTTRTLRPRSQAAPAIPSSVVVLPTPPFWATTAHVTDARASDFCPISAFPASWRRRTAGAVLPSWWHGERLRGRSLAADRRA